MGLDLFVMPLWRYRAGQFQGPIEALGATRIGAAKPDDPEAAARAWAGNSMDEIEKPIWLRWHDIGLLNLQRKYGEALKAGKELLEKAPDKASWVTLKALKLIPISKP